MVIDFFHVDSFEFWEYQRIGEALGQQFRPVLPSGNSWFDQDKARDLYLDAGVPFQNEPSPDADAVVTTQYHSSIFLPEYQRAISFRLMYGLCSEKGFNHSATGSLPFHAVLVPGDYSRDLLTRFTEPLVVGMPKYDAYFRGDYDRAALETRHGLVMARETVLYVPTWADESSVRQPAIRSFLEKLSMDRNVIIKPHHVTMRHEHEAMETLSHLEGPRMVQQMVPLGELLAVTDYVICDALSGVFWESILIGRKPTLGLQYGSTLRPQHMEKRIDEFAVISRDPSRLAVDFDNAIRFHRENTDALQEQAHHYLAFTDGDSGQRAAQAILEFTETRRKRHTTRDRIRWNLLGSLGAGDGLVSGAARNLLRAAWRTVRGRASTP